MSLHERENFCWLGTTWWVIIEDYTHFVQSHSHWISQSKKPPTIVLYTSSSLHSGSSNNCWKSQQKETRFTSKNKKYSRLKLKIDSFFCFSGFAKLCIIEIIFVSIVIFVDWFVTVSLRRCSKRDILWQCLISMIPWYTIIQQYYPDHGSLS